MSGLVRAGINPAVGLVTFAIGAVGGLAATKLGLPLPMMIGPTLAVGAASVLGLTIRGCPPKVPSWLRPTFVPIIGIAIGGAFTPTVLREMPSWWPTLLALIVFIPTVHWLGYHAYRAFGGLDRATAYYSAVPGGLIEVIHMGEDAGADPRILTMLQFLRLILTLLLVPLAFSILTGSAVGSSSGALIAKSDDPTMVEVLVLAVSAVVGFFGGRRLRFPAYIITGPILVSGVAHMVGLVESVPPGWLVNLTQLVVGVSLGTRFVGLPVAMMGRGIVLAAINIVVIMVLAVLTALALSGVVGQPVPAVILAFSPGGVAEMSLVAVSLEMSVIYVTAHHVLRIMVSVSGAKLFEGRLAAAEAAERAHAHPRG